MLVFAGALYPLMKQENITIRIIILVVTVIIIIIILFWFFLIWFFLISFRIGQTGTKADRQTPRQTRACVAQTMRAFATTMPTSSGSRQL